MLGCDSSSQKAERQQFNQYITILGIAQDAGYPQINCEKECCKAYYDGKEKKKLISCIGLVDMDTKQKWFFDATPDINEQPQILKDQYAHVLKTPHQ